jgi:hypothetical protein
MREGNVSRGITFWNHFLVQDFFIFIEWEFFRNAIVIRGSPMLILIENPASEFESGSRSFWAIKKPSVLRFF